MKRFIAVIFGAALIFAPLAPVNAVRAGRDTGSMLAASDGHGTIFLAWFPAVGGYPSGGWRLSEVEGSGERTIRARIEPTVPHLYGDLQTRNMKAETNAYAILGLRAFTDPAFAQEAGLAYTLQGVSRGAHRYRVTPLDAAGRPSGQALTSPAMDASVLTPLPQAPGHLYARAVRGGVALYWLPSLSGLTDPVFSYRIERGEGSVEQTEITKRPLVISLTARADIPRYVDTGAPLGQRLTYRVYPVDLFGRRGSPATVSILAADIRAMDPPDRATAVPGSGEVTLSWVPRESVNTAGYIIERAEQVTGPYTPLQRSALGPRTGRFVDQNVRPGTLYYYRILAVSPQGTLGPPSTALAAQPKGAFAPPTAGGLRADSGAARVRLTWRPISKPVAGYFVQRKIGNGDRWTTLTAKVSPVPRYDDYDVRGNERISYRVITVGFDNQLSTPSESVAVVRVVHVPPPAPRIRRIDGSTGNAILEFSPVGSAPIREFVIARGADARDAGVVVGQPLPAGARRFVDPTVHAGSTYFYRVYAVDAAGLRSEASQRIGIRIASADIPTPAAPRVTYDAKPYPSVTIDFTQPGKGIGVLVYRRTAAQPWVLVAGPVLSAKRIADLHPVAHATLAYRIVYLAPDRRRSSPSAASQVRIP